MSGKYLILAAFVLLTGAGSPPIVMPQPGPLHPWVAACKNDDDWDKPGPPFQIYGNTYYVGTCGITSLLITSLEGDVLIDSGTERGADLVLENIRALGFDPHDVKILLSSHEHFDRVGGMAKLQQATGAQVFASAEAAKVLRSGKAGEDDPQFGMHQPMQPVANVTVIARDVRLGKTLSLTPLPTPGHTPGATSWKWISCEGEDCRQVVYADSLSPVSSDGYRFTDHPEYLAKFEASIRTIGALDCRILLTPHPSASQMREKLLGSDLAWQFGLPCEDYARSLKSKLRLRLANEAAQ